MDFSTDFCCPCMDSAHFYVQLRGNSAIDVKTGGGVAEWLMALAWKAGVRRNPYREFESHPLRQPLVSQRS
jgi:hypothetical protein